VAVVRLPALLVAQAEGRKQFEVDGATLGETLHALPIADLLFDERGELRRLVNVYVDGRPERELAAAVAPDAEIRIVQAVAGGEQRRLDGAAQERGAGSAGAGAGMTDIRDVAEGLWLWRQPHPDWKEGLGWNPDVSSFCVESRGEVAVLDALRPPWERLDERPPTLAVVLKPDHVRDVDAVVARYGCPAFGPDLFFRGDAPESELEWLYPGFELPGGLVALHDGRGRNETPLWLPEQRALVFADGLTAPEGELRVWWTPWHEQRVLPALRDLLELPFELVLVSHGEPVHDRAAFEAALRREPHAGD
jgi:hypothetical protein